MASCSDIRSQNGAIGTLEGITAGDCDVAYIARKGKDNDCSASRV